MTTFVFTQALNTINNKINYVKNTYSNSPLGQYINYENNKTTWKKDKISGRLSELSIQTSTYNKIIPIVYGTNKLAGNVIWLGNVKEIVNNNTTTIKIGKGQKIKQNSIEYIYYLSFAIAICQGKIEKLNNVWADTNLLDLSKYSHRFYNGDENQKPDTLIESIEGVGKVSAYKGICYIVFENFPLSEFNNRIPNFLFEVTRQNTINTENNTDSALEKSIKGINIMPNFGETLLHTELQYKAGEQFASWAVDVADGIWYPLNANNNNKISDGLYCVNSLLETFPNCEYFIPHIAFFADSLDIATCKLQPRITFNFFHTGYPIYTRTDRFSAGVKWDRYNTPMMGKDGDKFRFSSGTISNGSILSFFKKLKESGKKAVFCPDILVDMKNTPDKNLITGSPENIHNFFTKTDGYNEFILGYANALKGVVDVFLIGNNLYNLTSIEGENGVFPAVDELVELAKSVKAIVGDKVKVSYAANFKEYHNLNGWYNLDKLWGCDAIDFIGINAYFPLTYSPQDEITKDVIKKGWFSGEYYDYEMVDGKKIAIEDKYACKNIKYWWENNHINPNGNGTDWLPKSKKIWFTEYGFCSIDATTNEPYKRVGKPPIYSDGNIDFFAQKTAIEATEEAFEGCEYVENKFLYCWDARPYPFYPNRTDLWDDCEDWKYNYCLNGKTGISNANIIIHQLFIDAGIDINLIDSVEVDEFVDGLIINNNMSVMDVLYLLQKVYFFDCIEDDGKIRFISNKSNMRKNQTITDVYLDDLVKCNEKYVDVEVIDGDDLPKKLNLIFLDKNNDYDTTSVYAERESVEGDRVEIETLPVVLDEEKARNVAETSLYLYWLEKSIFNFVLPIKYTFLNASDLIKLYLENKAYLLKIKTIVNENNLIKIQATQFDNEIYNYSKSYLLNPNIEIIGNIGATNMKIIELPAINRNMLDKIYLFFAVSSDFSSWKGANIYCSMNSGRTYNIVDSVRQKSLMGAVFNTPKLAKPYCFDYENKLNVFFIEGIDLELLENIDDLELYNGANLALYGNEIIQFKNIELTKDGSYMISGLLRGLYDTENEINKHKKGDIFLILNDNLIFQNFDFDKINFYCNYKAVSFDRDLADAEEIVYSIKGKNLLPFAPCHLKIEIKDNTIFISWKEKRRGYTNWTDYEDYGSVENNGKYQIKMEFESKNNSQNSGENNIGDKSNNNIENNGGDNGGIEGENNNGDNNIDNEENNSSRNNSKKDGENNSENNSNHAENITKKEIIEIVEKENFSIDLETLNTRFNESFGDINDFLPMKISVCQINKYGIGSEIVGEMK